MREGDGICFTSPNERDRGRGRVGCFRLFLVGEVEGVVIGFVGWKLSRRDSLLTRFRGQGSSDVVSSRFAEVERWSLEERKMYSIGIGLGLA